MGQILYFIDKNEKSDDLMVEESINRTFVRLEKDLKTTPTK